MEDIDLQHEIGDSGVLRRRHGRNSVRRVYSAKVEGRTSNVTVAVYQGDGADEEWRRDIAKYMAIRHPNILQICGRASTGSIHATLFCGDLVPFKQFVAGYSPVMTVYLYAIYHGEWAQVEDYFSSAFQQKMFSALCTIWIRRSTGVLSADFAPPALAEEVSFDTSRIQLGSSADHTIDSLPLRQYHDICDLFLGQYRMTDIPNAATVTLGGITNDYANYLACAEVDFYDGWSFDGDVEMDAMESGWKRCWADDHESFPGISFLPYSDGFQTWLSQANHVFSRLNIDSNLAGYSFMHYAQFRITFSHPCPPGYLFLCPDEDFKCGPTSFRWPTCPAYWSLDPSGLERLTTERAIQLGFPAPQLRIEVCLKSWDASVYTGLRQFHQLKGFHAESQDIARHLGHPLFRVLSEPNLSSAHVNESNPGDGFMEDENAEGHVELEENTSNVLSVDREMLVPTHALRWLMNVQLTLILFIALCWIYENMR
ncbi:hypothetical protein C8R46DRAFT_1092837 [Mycena filopes]|nr:hypothetical protein C8R46DRAFT_1092837 [Mycena filopes]